MSDAPGELFWPAERLAEALERTARRAGFPLRSSALERGGTARVESIAARLGIEAEALDVAYGDLEERLVSTLPALVVLGPAAEVAAIVGRKGPWLLVLTPELGIRRVHVDAITRRLCRAIESPAEAEIDRILAGAALPAHRFAEARRAVLREKLRAARVHGIFALRPPSSASVREDLRRAGVAQRFAALLGAHAAQYVLWILSWWVVGRAALDGRFDRGWFQAWALLLLSLVPFRLLATWSQGAFAVAAGAVLKKKLLVAALRLDTERVRGQGLGRFVGRVIESEAIESLALSGGIAAMTAVVELAVAAAVIALVPGGVPLALALAAWTALVLAAGAWSYRRRGAWTSQRLELSHDLIEKMVGHRTRLAQEPRGLWHAGEDAGLERYLETSGRMDRATAWLAAVTPRGWLLLGILGIAPGFLHADASAPALAAELGGVLLGYLAMHRLAHGIAQLGGAVIAWKQVMPMLAAAAREEAPGADVAQVTDVASVPGSPASADPVKVLQVRGLAFRHPGRSEELFRDLSLEVCEGDRILLEGPSGCGKSTFASLLTGLRTPDGGVVLLRGVDHETVGAETWRRRVAAAPQFHENHVLTETLAFNLLMGLSWPPREEDWKRAEDLCGELGLSDLIARMPAGMNEIVGESGWQLSHGERSRLFMARALLQESDLVVLDESFAALDPATLETSLGCALRRAKTLLVIAHP